MIPSAPFTFPWSCWPSSCSSLAPLELHQTSSKRDLPRGPCTLQALGGSLWDFYTPLFLHGREKKWPAWLYRIRRPTFILRMVAHLTASAARTILKTCLRCFDAIFRRAEAGPGRAEAWAGRAEAQNGGFLIWSYQKIGEIWSWAGRDPKWGLLNK